MSAADILSAVVNVVFNGLAYAMVLYLISVGLSVTMGMMGFVNLAHGVFAMAGGYIVTSLMKNQGVPFPLALLGAALAVAAASIPVERLLYRRFYGEDDLDQVLLTIGLVFMSVAGATYVWGPLQQPLQPPAWLSAPFDLGFRSFPAYRSFLIVVAVGGLGSIRGPFFAAVLLGVTDTASKYLVPEFGAFFIYALTLAVLLWRPRGLFGRA